jgi:pentapeptide MXKDX repeat protein
MTTIRCATPDGGRASRGREACVTISNGNLKRVCLHPLLRDKRIFQESPRRVTMKTRLLLAALIATSFAFAPAAMAEDTMSKPAMSNDKMDHMDKKDSMSKSKPKKSGMKKDGMSKDHMMSDDKMKN